MLNKLIVTAYKIAGFVILICILVGLGSYVVTAGFYFASSSWMAPFIIAPNDRRVVELKAQLAQQQTLRDGVAAQREEMLARLRDAERTIAAEKAFQGALRASVGRDAAARGASAGRLAALKTDYSVASAEISKANTDFAGLSRTRMREMFAAHLADRDDVLRGNMELASLAGANLNLSERVVLLDDQIIAARRQIAAFKHLDKALAAGDGYGGTGEALTREALAALREHELSVGNVKRAEDTVATLRVTVASADAALKRYDALLDTIKTAPQLLASNAQLNVGFVPYTNMNAAAPGTTVYACRANLVWCRKVGKVGKRLDGEITGHHPVQKLEIRGVLVQVELTDSASAEEVVLHLGRAPLFI
jgi:hypothetical protein